MKERPNLNLVPFDRGENGPNEITAVNHIADIILNRLMAAGMNLPEQEIFAIRQDLKNDPVAVFLQKEGEQRTYLGGVDKKIEKEAKMAGIDTAEAIRSALEVLLNNENDPRHAPEILGGLKEELENERRLLAEDLKEAA